MSHDKFGQLLKVGDVVLIRAIVRETTDHSDNINITIEGVDYSKGMWADGKQVEKERAAQLRAHSSSDAPVGQQSFSE